MARINDSHKWVIIDFLTEYPALLSGRVDDCNSESRSELERLKEAFADAVNTKGDLRMNKDADQAYKSFTDWKRITLRKAGKAVAHARGTGGGEPLFTNFSEVDQALLDLLGPEAYSMPSIKEGGFPSPQRSSSQGIASHRAKGTSGKGNRHSSSNNIRTYSTVQARAPGPPQSSTKSYRNSTVHALESVPMQSFPQLHHSRSVPVKPPQNKLANYSMSRAMEYSTTKDNDDCSRQARRFAMDVTGKDQKPMRKAMRKCPETATSSTSSTKSHAANYSRIQQLSHPSSHASFDHDDDDITNCALNLSKPPNSSNPSTSNGHSQPLFNNLFPRQQPEDDDTEIDSDASETSLEEIQPDKDIAASMKSGQPDGMRDAENIGHVKRTREETEDPFERKIKLKREELEAHKMHYELDYELRVEMFEFQKEKLEMEDQRHQELLQAINKMNDNIVNLLERK